MCSHLNLTTLGSRLKRSSVPGRTVKLLEKPHQVDKDNNKEPIKLIHPLTVLVFLQC